LRVRVLLLGIALRLAFLLLGRFWQWFLLLRYLSLVFVVRVALEREILVRADVVEFTHLLEELLLVGLPLFVAWARPLGQILFEESGLGGDSLVNLEATRGILPFNLVRQSEVAITSPVPAPGIQDVEQLFLFVIPLNKNLMVRFDEFSRGIVLVVTDILEETHNHLSPVC